MVGNPGIAKPLEIKKTNSKECTVSSSLVSQLAASRRLGKLIHAIKYGKICKKY
jgi:hypothetical protein